MPVRRLLMLLAAGVFFAPMIGQEPAVAGPRTDAALVDSTNDLRAARGLPRMKVSPTLSKLAYRHSMAMARKGKLWHNDISSATDHWVWLGQNVEVGSSVEALQRAFMAAVAPDPLTAWRPRWHHRRALSWAASSVGRAPGF
jgi:uncharacterized protein YkwD